MEAERSCTSRPCAWSSATSKKDAMVPIDQVELGRPGKRSKKLKTQPCHTSEKYNSSEREIFEALKRVNLKAVVLRSIPKLDPEETDSASEDEEMYTFLRNARKSRSTRETFLDDMFLPLSEVERIEKSTRLSSESPIWYAARYGRITATTMSRAPFLGATPGGLWSCSCHGVGLVEIKCPWSLREPNHSVLEAPYLNDQGHLIEKHPYYTQTVITAGTRLCAILCSCKPWTRS
ncbi:hypothetical protein V5799_006373 [Amblyomma americanum]|uniref:YqaJ viral recombinase domain-containing protein n=1 Tax=Amblyomma americanum TaxID=6943 RepID=A0AAQ4DWK7_AMBAM